MFLDLAQLPDVPNEFSNTMGQLLKQAREERNWSQAYLADLVQARRPSISDIENGKRIPDLILLLSLASALDKPLNYFIPPAYRTTVEDAQELSMYEMLLLLEFRRMQNPDIQKLAIEQVRTLAGFELRLRKRKEASEGADELPDTP